MEFAQQHHNRVSYAADDAAITETEAFRRAERDRFAEAIGLAEIERDAAFVNFAAAT